MRVKDKLYPHIYPTVISQDLFDRCEAVRLGKTRQMRPVSVSGRAP